MTRTVEYRKGMSALDYLSEEEKKKYYCCKIKGRIKELNYRFADDGVCDIEYLELDDQDAARIYTTSVRFLISMAAHEIYPKVSLRLFYNISRSLFAKVMYPKNYKVTDDFVYAIRKRMMQLVDMDLPFVRRRLSKKEAIDLYRSEKMNDKIQVVKYRKENYVHLYQVESDKGLYIDYLYGPMVPSTGYLKEFIVRPYAPGFLVQVPRSECGGKIPPFIDEKKFATSLASTSRWAEDNQLSTVSDINRFIKTYDSMSLINISEARINNMLAELGEEIYLRKDLVRVICVAGPSSSGKTSFANRLMFELMARGLRPIRISIDNFYIPRDDLAEGTDIESIEALDLPYFNSFINGLIQGKSLADPVYDFKTGLRTFGKDVSVEEGQPIIIEGIHALNPRMTNEIPDFQKYKIYISPQPQVNIDDHTPISMTDMRLIRRIARDSRTRGSDAAETIRMWPNVRNGEFNYIYPTQEYADFVFDSFYPYELCVLKDIVYPQLDKITSESPEFLMSLRLKNMVRYFCSISTDDIPCNSLMREFVGGSSFKDAR